MSSTSNKNNNPYILMLPRWYPNIVDGTDGNFIEKHIHCISRNKKVVVLFVKGVDTDIDKELEVTQTGNHFTYKAYFKNYPTIFGKVLNFLRYLRLQESVYKKIKERYGSPSLCHVHVMARTSWLALRLKSSKKTPLIISEHWAAYYPESRKLNSFKKLVYRFILNKADAITAVSASLASAMTQIGVKLKIHIIPNIINSIFLQTELKKAPDNVINIVHISNLYKDIKRVDGIIRAVEALAESSYNLHLTIIGDGPDRADLEVQAANCTHMKDRIVFRGDISQKAIAEILQNSHISVMFSKFETQSVVLLESIAMGIPVVAPRVGGIPEHFEDKGILFKEGSEVELIESLKRLIKNKENFEPLKLRKYAEDHFSEKTVESKFHKLYESLIQDAK